MKRLKKQLGKLSFGLATFSVVLAFVLDRMISIRDKDMVLNKFGFLASESNDTAGSVSMAAPSWTTISEPVLIKAFMILGTAFAIVAILVGLRSIFRGKNDVYFSGAVCIGILGLLLNARFFAYGV